MLSFFSNGPFTSKVEKPKYSSSSVLLNLGCGDKKLPGYINVDCAVSRKGIVPDVVADLRKLPFPDGYADEVLSVHVIEHFYQWEAAGLLSEWRRVLKPGGRIVVECPNLLYAAKRFCAEHRTAGPGKEGQSTLWVFYGDPNWRDPLMCHKWGYTPQSLMEALRTAGYVDLRREPAQFKKKEPRDMRVTARKPAEPS